MTELRDKEMWHRGRLQWHLLHTKFHENPPIISKFIIWGGQSQAYFQTGWWFD
jgi:hypothetical protein